MSERINFALLKQVPPLASDEEVMALVKAVEAAQQYVSGMYPDAHRGVQFVPINEVKLVDVSVIDDLSNALARFDFSEPA